MKSDCLNWIIVLLVSLIFGIASLSKLADPESFGTAILRYQLVDPRSAWVAALWIPWMECLCAVSLWFGRFRRAAGILLLCQILIFQIALASAWARGLDIDCGCFGTSTSSSVSFAFIRNFFLIAGLVILLQRKFKHGEESNRSIG